MVGSGLYHGEGSPLRERVMLSIFAAMGLLAMGCAVGLMGLGMHYLPGAWGVW